MDNRFFVPVVLIILMAGALYVHASGSAGQTGFAVKVLQPAGMPQGIANYIQINITNTQQIQTGSNFQYQLVVNSRNYSQYEASNLQNIEFFYGNGTVVPSWLQYGNNSTYNSTYWLNLRGGIPALSNLTIYMGFANTTVNLFNNVTTGEAPQLSASWAQYDNGANIFYVYNSFPANATGGGWFGVASGFTIPAPTVLEYTKQQNGNSTVYYLRIRSYPPSGVMPVSSFGQVRHVTPPQVTLSLQSNNINHGVKDTITANCIGNGGADNCAIWYGSTQLANAISTVTYNAGLLNAGTYYIYAYDLTTGLVSPVNVLSVSPSTTANYPLQRWGGSMVYDAASGYYLLFGGSDGQSDTWEYSGGVWTQVNVVSAPHPRTNACMAYDPASKSVILFGGLAGGGVSDPYLNDTWSYSNGAWTNITNASGSMPGIGYSSCAWDPAGNYILLFGGYAYTNSVLVQNGNETWTFSNGKWTRLFPAKSPAGRYAPSMAYDYNDGYMVMYAGERNPTKLNYLNDTWEYANGAWTNITQQAGAAPPNRWEASMINYSNGVILFGGQINLLKNNGTAPQHSSQNQTWQFTGGRWYNVTPLASQPNPPTRFDTQAAYDPVTNSVTIFSGLSATAVNSVLNDDTWSFSNGQWTPITNTIIFREIGLTPPTKWSVTLVSDSQGVVNLTDEFNRPNGEYKYTVSGITGYTVSPTSGTVYVDNPVTIINLTFTG